ncbi:MAG: ankyrin repeat domain-containing protein [Parashewanella sp.]
MAPLIITTTQDPSESFTEISFNDNESLLLESCANGSLKHINAVLSGDTFKDTSTNSKGLNGLHLACLNGQIEVVKLLARNGANINLPAANDFKETPLHIAVRLENKNLVTLLLGLGANLEMTCSNDLQPLHLAVLSRNRPIVETLLNSPNSASSKAHCLAKDSSGNSALYYACAQHQLDIVQLMLDHLTKNKTVDDEQKTQIIETLTLLLPKPNSHDCQAHLQSAIVNFKRGLKVFGNTEDEVEFPSIFKKIAKKPLENLLEYAALCDQLLVFKALTKLGITSHELPCLEVALWANSPSVVNFILKSGPQLARCKSTLMPQVPTCYIAVIVDVNLTKAVEPAFKRAEQSAKDLQYNALGYAVLSRRKGVLQYLLTRYSHTHFNVSSSDKAPQSALHFAIEQNKNRTIICTLLDAHLATASPEGKPTVEQQACFHTEDSSGNTPLESAIIQQEFEAASLIMARMTTKYFDAERQHELMLFLHQQQKLESIVWLFIQPAICECKKAFMPLLLSNPHFVEKLVKVREIELLELPEWLTLFANFFRKKDYATCRRLLELPAIKAFFNSERFPATYKYYLPNTDPEGLSLLLDAGMQVNAEDAKGYTPLFYVVHSSLKCTAILLCAGASTEHTVDGKTALQAFRANSKDSNRDYFRELEILLELPPQVGVVLLFHRQLPKLQKSEVLPLSQAENDEAVAFFQLVQSSPSKEQVEQFVNSEKQIPKYVNSYFGVSGLTAIHFLVYASKYECLPILEKAGANIYQPTSVTQNTIMHIAAQKNKVRLIKQYCTYKKFYSLRNYNNRTPIMEAFLARHTQIGGALDTLLHHRPHDISEKLSQVELNNRRRLTKINQKILCDYSLLELEDMLKHPLYSNVINDRDFEFRYTPVELSIIVAKPSMLQLLLNKNASLDLPLQSNGENLLHLFFYFDSHTEDDLLSMWDILSSHIELSTLRVLATERNEQGQTPLALARSKGDSKLVNRMNMILVPPDIKLILKNQ